MTAVGVIGSRHLEAVLAVVDPVEEEVVVREEERLRGRAERRKEEGNLASKVAVRKLLIRVHKHPQCNSQQEDVARRRDQPKTNNL